MSTKKPRTASAVLKDAATMLAARRKARSRLLLIDKSIGKLCIEYGQVTGTIGVHPGFLAVAVELQDVSPHLENDHGI